MMQFFASGIYSDSPSTAVSRFKAVCHFFKYLFCILFSCFALVLPVHSAGWELVFSDEFNGHSLDRNKWATRYIYENETLDRFNDEKERYRDYQNHVLSDGVLSLVARRDEAGVYESGMIRTHRTFYYGYYEARVFLPAGKGVWPAFWLVGDYDIDGKTWHPPEIDIFEYVINGVEDKDNMLHSAVADKSGNDAEAFSYVDPSFRLKHKELYADGPLNAAWHTAGLVWAPDRVSFFWDGRHIYTRSYKWLRKDGLLGPPAQVVLNFAVGGGWAGRHGIDASVFPQAFKIDHVRICQFTPGAKGGRLCGGSSETPNPEEFGYTAPFNDMAKPVLLPAKFIGSGGRVAKETATFSGNEHPVLRIPFRLPEGYPNDRTMNVSFINDETGASTASLSQRLEDGKAEGGRGDMRSLEFVVPSLAKGTYLIQAAVTTASGGKSGQMQSVPVSCQTGVAQPEKARSCRFLQVEAVQ